MPLPSTAAERQLHSAFHSEFARQGTLLKLPIGKTLLKVTQMSKSKDMILSLLPYHPTILGLQFIEEYTLTSTSVYISIQIALGTNKLTDISFTKKENLL